MRTIENNDMPFRVGLGVAVAVLALLILRLRFGYEVEVPSLPPRPQPRVLSAVEVERTIERSPEFYAGHLRADAAALGLEGPPPTAADMGRSLPYRSENPRLVLDPSNKKARRGEVLGLALSTSVHEIEGTPDRQMVLTIENTTDQHLAYRVTTRPSKGVTPCHRKRDLAHNAVALAPGATERRSECLWNRGWELTVDRVEVIELSPLSFHYVSMLPAGQPVGFDARTSRGHRSSDRSPLCRLFHSAELVNNLRSGVTTWRDVIDFYARHRCKTYTIPTGYRAVAEGKEIALPAVAEGG